MLKFFLSALQRRKFTSDGASSQAWRCDPLAHPVLDRMSPVELADLPLGSVRYDCGRN
jgi:hypothetical protein